MRRALAVTGLLVALLLAPSALAQGGGGGGVFFAFGQGPARDFPTSYSTRDISARLTGDLVVTFHGDAASGCARRGLCGYSGTLVWTPANPSSLEIDGTTVRRRTGYEAGLWVGQNNVANGGGTTHVDTEYAGTVCADATYSGSYLNFPISHGRVHIELTDSHLPSVVQSRCAGPLLSDLATALPSVTVPLSRLIAGQTRISLHGQKRFGSHGFAGTVESTLSLALDRPGPWSRTKLKRSEQRQHLVAIEYRAALSGRLVAAVDGDADQGLCGPLGACGVSGTVSLDPRAVGTAIFAAEAAVKYPYSELLRGLRRGHAPKHVEVSGSFVWRGDGTTTARLGRPGALCFDSTRFGQQQGIVRIGTGRISFQYINEDFTSDPFRTRCPGPLSPNEPFASGDAPRSILGRSAAVIPLSRGVSFTDDGYTGRISSTLVVRLTDRKVLRQTVVQVVAGN
jgi:hypothetical protein